MMKFANPAALALLAAILLLLFGKRRKPHVPVAVGNLYLWKEVASETAAPLSRRKRHDAQLILQIAFLVALVLAIAGLLLPSGSHRVAIIVDASMSMGAGNDTGTRFDEARKRVASLLGELPRGTTLRLIAAVARPVLIGEFDRSDGGILDAIQTVRGAQSAADLGAAIEYARTSDPAPARIYVFSDADPSQIPSAAAEDVDWTTIGRPTNNVAVTVVSTRPDAASAADNTQVLVRVTNYGDAVVNAPLTLDRNGAILATTEVNLSAGAASTYTFKVSNGQGVLVAQLHHEDALEDDNVRRIVMPGPSKIRVVPIGDLSFYLGRALSTHPDVIVGEPTGSGHDVTVCDRCADLPDGDTAVLVVPPPAAPTADQTSLVTIADRHPLADGLDLHGALAIPVPGDRLPDGATVVAQGGGMPVLAAYEIGLRRVVELRANVSSGPLPLSAAFPVLISNVIKWLANREGNPVTLIAGQPLQWQIAVQRERPTVLGPDGRSRPVVISGNSLTVVDTDRAGVYRVRLDDGERLVVMNPQCEGESALNAPSPAARAGTAVTIEQAMARRDNTTALALLALLLLAIEWRYRQPRRLA